MSDFLSYLTDERIVAQLCKEAGKYIFMPANRPKPAHIAQLLGLLPPAAMWNTFKDTQQDQSEKGTVRKKTIRCLRRLVMRHLTLTPPARHLYLRALRPFMAGLRSCAEHPEAYTFPKPAVIPKLKKQTAEQIVFRPTCAYHDLTAKILTALMASYLKSWLDPLLHYTNMAYRAPREWMGQNDVVTSNVEAVDMLLRWRAEHDSQDIYIAECDIQKFFDTIDHDAVISVLREMMRRDHRTDPAFVELFRRFISSFDFRSDVMQCNDNPDYWCERIRDYSPDMVYRFDWISDPPSEPVGIPQGSALSPLIANMLLNAIDERVLGDRLQNGHITDDSLLYLRYCDDILIAHTSPQVCADLLEAYCDTLRLFHLRYHPMQSVADMKHGCRLSSDSDKHFLFWNAKSKRPYRWGPGPGDSAEWIGFLGYEVSRDGRIRLRKSSVANQADKIWRRADSIAHDNEEDREKRIGRFAASRIGGSKIDKLTHIVDDAPYHEQFERLKRLKQRKIRKLQGMITRKGISD